MPDALIGASIPRLDGADKVAGRALYVDDLTRPGMLHGATLRSTVAHGVLRALARDPGFDWSGITVVTAADILGDNVIALLADDQPALVPEGGKVMHADEPLALVAAPSRELARAALAHFHVLIEPLPEIYSIEDGLAHRVTLYGDDNVFKRIEIRKGDAAAALARATHVIEGTYVTGAQEQMYIEPQGMLAWWDNGAVHVKGSMQCPYYVHHALKRLLALDGARVIVAQATTGGGFGGKEEYPSMIAAHAALLARKAGRPVKLVYDRSEDIGATTKRHPCRVVHKLGVNQDGTLAAMDIDVVFDGGAYVTLSPVVLSRGVIHAAGPYRCDHVRVVGRVVATNTPPHGAFRGFGAPQTTFAYERQMSKAARLVGADPLAFRRLNMLRPGDTTATGQKLTSSVGGAEVLAAVAKAARRRTKRPKDRRLRGRGLAFYFHGAGFTGSGEERLQGQVSVATRAGGGFEVRSASTDIGQGALTIFAQIAATALGVPLDQVHIAEPSTDRVPNSGPTVASRTCMVVGSVVAQAASALRAELLRFAALRGLPTGELGRASTARHAELGEASHTATYHSPPGIRWSDDTYQGDAYPVYGWACALADVAIDPDTFEVSVERLVHAVDVGKAIHPIIVKGQIEGGTLQALGWALWENVVYAQGRVQNRRMTDCIIPTSMEAPEMETVIIEVPYPHGPHGAKGVGEIPIDGPAAAVASAIENALNLPFDRLPVLPEDIARAVAGQRRKRRVA
ncbi:MAG: xanthine dehydrogenase family protein [Deltaproteobacteria bacterium]|nr:xanthine dehydrogenase family protein [Deltaproteobacteria bacterium]